MLGRQSKYLNKKVIIDGQEFDSRKEGKFYLLFKEKELKGDIFNLRTQVNYEIIPAVYEDVEKHLKTKTKTIRKCIQRASYYVADFVYTDKDGNEVVVDVKSPITRINPVYRLKKKMMLAFNNIKIKEL